MAELVLSASSMEAYRKCHYRWYLQYIERQQGEQGVKQARGLAVHAAVEEHYQSILDGAPITIEQALDVHDMTFLMESLDIFEPDEDLDKAREIGRRVTRAYLEDVAPEIEPEFVEEPGRLIINGIHVSYHFDLADRKRKVRDLKVKASKPRWPDMYADAMNIYALGYREKTGEIESDVQLDVMIALKRDRPYLVPISNGGPVSSTAIGILAAHLEDTAEGIDRGDFAPTGLETDACRWCPVRTVCEPYLAQGGYE